MNRETSLKPVLCIDLKKNRIRIHKLTLHMLGDPEYIQLLVNPQDSMIAIRKSVRKDYLAHRVRYRKADSHYCYELYSTELLQALRHTGIHLEGNRSYRIYGALNPRECLASFSMNECVLAELQTDPEFDELIQPREEKYLEELEENIFDHGCREPICIWNGIILDGRLRYKICTKWDIHYNIQRMMFESRDKAVSFICHEQLKRTDLTGEYKKYLIGRLFRAGMNTAIDEFVKEHPDTELNADGQVSQKYVRKTDIATIIGNEFNFGFSTVTKYDIYARAVDDLKRKSPEIAEKILNGKLRVSHENIIELSRLPIEDINGLKRLLDSGSIDRIGYSQLRHELRWQRLPTGKPDSRRIKREKESAEAGIKQMPATDPDAELESLKFTIPSWSKTISRTMELTDFPSTSVNARREVKMQLLNLTRKITRLLSQLEEDDPDDRRTDSRTNATGH